MGDFGGKLRAARERKGVSLRQIAAATKISVSSLEALERNDISRLPGGIFTRAFVRSYAIEVGLDPDEIVKEFLTQFASEAPPTAPIAPRPPAASLARGPAGARENVSDETEFESQQRMASVVLKLLIASVPVAIAILYLGTRAPAPVAVPAADSPARAATAVPEPAPEPPIEAAPPHADAVDPTPAPETEPPAVPETAAAAAETVRLELVPTEDCWAQLTVDGEVVLSRVVAAGERATHGFRQWAVLLVGDAAACAVTIDGRPMRALGGPRQVRQVRLTRENYTEFLR